VNEIIANPPSEQLAAPFLLAQAYADPRLRSMAAGASPGSRADPSHHDVLRMIEVVIKANKNGAVREAAPF
jgi:hypothetical protein